LRQIAGVLPSCCDAARTAAATCVTPTRSSRRTRPRSRLATYTLPFHVRKSFVLISS